MVGEEITTTSQTRAVNNNNNDNEKKEEEEEDEFLSLNVAVTTVNTESHTEKNPRNLHDGEEEEDDDDLFGDDSEEIGKKNQRDNTNQDNQVSVKQESPNSSNKSNNNKSNISNNASKDDHTQKQQPKLSADKDDDPDLLSSIPKKIKQESTVRREVVSGFSHGAQGTSTVSSTGTTITTTTSPLSTSQQYIHGSVFGLSEAVRIPKSVDTKLLEGGILAKLKSLPANLANDALQEYDDALQIKGGSIRNQGAYLYGVIKRYTSVHERATTGGEGAGILPMGEEGLTPLVNSKLDTLVSSGFCTLAEMNDKVKSKIRMLSEKDALFAIDELASTDRSSIRNFGSFFMGILNRYMRGDTQSRHDPSPPSYTSSFPPHASSSLSSSSAAVPRNNRFDRNSYGHRDRSRDRGPPPTPPGHRRDLGGPSTGRQQPQPPMNPRQPTYDPRPHQQPPSWYQGSGPNHHGSTNQHQQHPSRLPTHGGGGGGRPPSSNFAPHQQQSLYQPPPPPPPPPPPLHTNHFVPGGGYAPPNAGQPQQFGQGMPPTTSNGYPSHPMGQAPPPQQQQQPAQYNMGNPPYQQQQQHQYHSSGPMGQPPQQQQQPPSGSYGGWQQPQQQPQGQMLDILALADKASSAVQALANHQNPYGGQHPYNNSTPYPSQQAQQHHHHHHPSPSFQSQPQQPPQQQPPAYGIPPGIPPPHQPAAPASFGQHQRSNNNNSSNSNNARSRHTTATLEMLSPQVQYAVQNLIATGHVERSPDDGILGMIYDLPEGLALSSIQKFVSIDKSSMRSRIAYLAGVLRRELEKLGLR